MPVRACGVGDRLEPAPPGQLGPERGLRVERVEGFPGLGGRHQGSGSLGPQGDHEVAGAPEIARRLVATAALHGIQDLPDRLAGDVKGGGRAVHPNPEPRQLRAALQLVAVVHDRERVGRRQRGVDRLLVRAKVDGRPDLQPNGFRALDEPVAHMNRVLAIGEQEALLEGQAAQLVAPDRKAQLESELGEIRDLDRLAGSAELPADRGGRDRAVGQGELLVQVAQHQHPAERGGQGRDQEPVIAPGHDRGDGARRIPTQPVGDQPFPGPEPRPLGRAPSGPGDAADRIGHRVAPNATAACPGRNQPAAGSSSGVPEPP